MRSRFLWTGIICFMAAGPAWSQARHMEKTLIQGDTMYTLMDPGDIPAIFQPEFNTIEESVGAFAPDEPLLVVEHDGTARAYSTWHLDEHEVVNDRFGTLPLAVTW